MKTLIALCVLASIAGADPAPHAVVVHSAPIVTQAGQPVEIEAMIDAPYVEKLAVRWRPIGGTTWQDVGFERSSAGGWYAKIPEATVPGVEYFIEGTDRDGAKVEHFASETSPHVVRVDPTLEDRLETLDLERLGGMRNEVSVDAMAHDFGNRYGARDRFARGEIIYAYRLLRAIHEIAFGFGTMFGHTPLEKMAGTDVLYRGMRYGFGQMRFRLHPSFFLDGRVGLGVSEEGFTGLAKIGATFGKPWRSCVGVSVELLGDTAYTATVRLQWDTAPPLLMGASINRTNMPGTVTSGDDMTAISGLYLAYDVIFRATDAITIRGQVSYGPRDGAARFGGGLGTAVAF